MARRELDTLTLTHAEVAALTSLDLSARPALDNARALFLLGVYTNLRFAGVVALHPEHILPDRLRLTIQKTRDSFTVPLLPETRALLARVADGTLRPLHNQVLNRRLKELAALAGIDTPHRAHALRGRQASYPHGPTKGHPVRWPFLQELSNGRLLYY